VVFFIYAESVEVAGKTSGRSGGVFWGEEILEARVGIGLRATLKIRKLLVLLNEKKAKNREFAVVRCTAGTRIAI
jgi:hypothetical protein